jgi:type VI secretion system protein ImpF
MAELTPKERLQPSLLDRLTDNEPDRKVEGKDLRVLSPQRLRESVRRDLTWLFNAVNLASVQDLSDHDDVARSTLNFGLPDLSGKSAVGVHAATL